MMSESFRLLLEDGDGNSEADAVQMEPTATVNALKSAIQNRFSIPACCQKLYFESLQLKDNDSCTLYRFRESDVINVRYETRADVNEVVNALNCLKELLQIFTEVARTSDVVKFNIALVQALPVKVMTLNQLGEVYFSKVSTNKYYTNMVLFMSNGGIDVLYKAHLLLLEHDQPPVLVLEAIFLLLWARLSLMRNCLDTGQMTRIATVLLRSFQRHEFKANDTTSPNDGSRIKRDVILLSLRAISNMTASYAGIRERIASSEGAMHQLNNVLTTAEPNSSSTVVGVLGTFENLSERMGVARTLSILVVSSAHVMTLPDLLRINIFLQRALEKVDIDAAHRFLHERLSGWIGTLKELANLVYYPYENPHFSCIQSYYSEEHKRSMRKLEKQCTEVGVVSLHIALLGEVEKTVLIKEGLADYIVCLPWCLPQDSREYYRACEMMSYLREGMVLQPPSLLNLAKAKLASSHFGLRKMLSTFSMQDLLLQ